MIVALLLFLLPALSFAEGFIPDEVDDLIDRLASASWEDREKATEQLEDWSSDINPRLRKAFKDATDIEVRWRLERILRERGTVRTSRILFLVMQVDGEGLIGSFDGKINSYDKLTLPLHRTASSTVTTHIKGWFTKDLKEFIGEIAHGRSYFKAPFNRLIRTRRGGYVCILRESKPIRWKSKDSFEKLSLPLIKKEIHRPAGNEVPPVLWLLTSRKGYRGAVPDLRKRMQETKDPFIQKLCKKAIQFQEASR